MYNLFRDVFFRCDRLNECLVVCGRLANEASTNAFNSAKSFAIEANTKQRIVLHQRNTLRNRARITECEIAMDKFSAESFAFLIDFCWLKAAARCLSSAIVSKHESNEDDYVSHIQSLHGIVELLIRVDVEKFKDVVNSAIACSVMDCTDVIHASQQEPLGIYPKKSNGVEVIGTVPDRADLVAACEEVAKKCESWKKTVNFEFSTSLLATSIYPQMHSTLEVGIEYLRSSVEIRVLTERNRRLFGKRQIDGEISGEDDDVLQALANEIYDV